MEPKVRVRIRVKVRLKVRVRVSEGLSHENPDPRSEALNVSKGLHMAPPTV